MPRLGVGLHQMVSSGYQDLKKPELSSSPTVTGVGCLNGLRNRWWVHESNDRESGRLRQRHDHAHDLAIPHLFVNGEGQSRTQSR
jgi:hypothetical protein